MSVDRPRKVAEPAAKASPELAVRAIVFMSRLFEYECRELGVSLAQYRLLLYLRRVPRRAGELAAQAAITRPSLSVLLVALEKAGLIRRSEVDGDGRGVQLELTRKGLTTLERMEKRFAEVLEGAAADADKERLIAALSELAIDLTDQVEQRVSAADPYKERPE